MNWKVCAFRSDSLLIEHEVTRLYQHLALKKSYEH